MSGFLRALGGTKVSACSSTAWGLLPWRLAFDLFGLPRGHTRDAIPPSIGTHASGCWSWGNPTQPGYAVNAFREPKTGSQNQGNTKYSKDLTRSLFYTLRVGRPPGSPELRMMAGSLAMHTHAVAFQLDGGMQMHTWHADESQPPVHGQWIIVYGMGFAWLGLVPLYPDSRGKVDNDAPQVNPSGDYPVGWWLLRPKQKASVDSGKF